MTRDDGRLISALGKQVNAIIDLAEGKPQRSGN